MLLPFVIDVAALVVADLLVKEITNHPTDIDHSADIDHALNEKFFVDYQEIDSHNSKGWIEHSYEYDAGFGGIYHVRGNVDSSDMHMRVNADLYSKDSMDSIYHVISNPMDMDTPNVYGSVTFDFYDV